MQQTRIFLIFIQHNKFYCKINYTVHKPPKQAFSIINSNGKMRYIFIKLCNCAYKLIYL